MHLLLKNSARFQNHISTVLDRNIHLIGESEGPLSATSSVLFLMSDIRPDDGGPKFPCLILTKRSKNVIQPGDLCFPGGGAAPRFDPALAKVLTIPGFPFAAWQNRTRLRLSNNHHRLSQYLATSLRESFEEMRLIPLGFRFLGPLPPHRLVLYDRIIHPMVGWVKHQRFFRINGEVEKLIYIPIHTLLNPDHYAFFKLVFPSGLPLDIDASDRDAPCFLHRQEDGTMEILWGATYRIVEAFLKQVFDFSPPNMPNLPRVKNPLPPSYFPTG